MLSVKVIFIATVLLGYYFARGSPLKPCKDADQECIDSNANAVYQQLIAGVPSLGIQPHEPLYHDRIEGDLSIIKFKLLDSTFKGFDKCKISNVKINRQASNLHFELFCPKFDFFGKYDISGRLIVLPVEGNGDYNITTGNYKSEIDCELKTVEGSDGHKHVHVKNYKIKSTALTALKYSFKNLFNGNKDLSDAVHKFANENWKEVADLLQDPIWSAHAKKFFSSANKYSDSVPLDD